MSITNTTCVIHWIEIYPVHSAIQILNKNWGPGIKLGKHASVQKQNLTLAPVRY